MSNLSENAPKGKDETSELCVPATAYNVGGEDDLGMVDDRFITFSEAGSIIFEVLRSLRGIDDILGDIDEHDEESLAYRHNLCQKGLQAVIADLERIDPRGSRGTCLVRISNPTAGLLKEIEDQERRGARLQDDLRERTAYSDRLFAKRDKAGAEVVRLKGEIRKALKERDALQKEQEQGSPEVAQ